MQFSRNFAKFRRECWDFIKFLDFWRIPTKCFSCSGWFFRKTGFLRCFSTSIPRMRAEFWWFLTEFWPYSDGNDSNDTVPPRPNLTSLVNAREEDVAYRRAAAALLPDPTMSPAADTMLNFPKTLASGLSEALGCINADFCNQILILQHFSRSTEISSLLFKIAAIEKENWEIPAFFFKIRKLRRDVAKFAKFFKNFKKD